VKLSLSCSDILEIVDFPDGMNYAVGEMEEMAEQFMYMIGTV
jgi:hypothetical protein